MFNLIRTRGFKKFNLNIVRYNFGSSHGHDSHSHHNDHHAHHDGHGHDDHGHHEITGEVDLDKVYVPLNRDVKYY